MKYIKLFNTHNDYETYIDSQDRILPNVSYCEDLNDVHYNPHSYVYDYLTFKALENGTITFSISERINIADLQNISYSTDNGDTWVTTNNVDNKSEVLTITVDVLEGDTVLWKGIGNKLTVIYGIMNTVAASKFNSTCNINVYGNIMSLLYGDYFLDKTTLSLSAALAGIFGSCSHLISAKKLILPATTLSEKCYESMFSNCTGLIVAPELPATTLASECYRFMFNNCTSLTTAPKLPATTLANSCYYAMFQNCTALTAAPKLLTTTLVSNCYRLMFLGCTSLTTAPDLPATTLESACYQSMFSGCTSLNYIKAMFTTTPSSSYTSSWVSDVAATGTFVKNSNAEWDVTGVNGIPEGWTVLTSGTFVS